MERMWGKRDFVVKTDPGWHGLHMLLHEAVLAVVQKDYIFVCFSLFFFFVLGLFVCLFSRNLLCFGIHFGMTRFLKRVDFCC